VVKYKSSKLKIAGLNHIPDNILLTFAFLPKNFAFNGKLRFWEGFHCRKNPTAPENCRIGDAFSKSRW
jgi:hypothetical protein